MCHVARRLCTLLPHPNDIKRAENRALWRAAQDACFNDDRVAQAAVLIGQYRELYPKEDGGRYLEAVNLGKRRQFERARAGLRGAEALYTKTSDRQTWLEDWADLCETAKDIEGEIEAYRELATLRPEHTAPHVMLGGALARQGNLVEAEAIHRHATTLPGDPDEAFLNLALVQRAMGRLQDAKHSCEQALALCPDYPDVIPILDDIEAAIALQEDSGSILNSHEHGPTRSRTLWIAALDASYGSTAQASILVSAYLEDSPEDGFAHLLHARSLAKTRSFDKAKQVFAECETTLRSPKHHLMWLKEWRDACELHLDMVAWEAACREIAAECLEDGYAWMQLGRCLATQGKHVEAETILWHACDLESDTAELSYLHLGLVLRDLGRLDEAAAAFLSGLRVLPSHHPCKVALVDVQAAQVPGQ